MGLQDVNKRVDVHTDESLAHLETQNVPGYYEQLVARYGKPGLVKAQLHSKNAKIKVLRGNKALMLTKEYKSVFLRGAKSHVEQFIVHVLNFKTVSKGSYQKA